jgi:hypothetical protein
MMKTWIWLGSAALATSLAVAACGGGGSAPLTEDQFCTQKATKECQVTARCGLATSDSCLTQRKALCLAFATAAKVSPRVFHPENVPNCINKTNNVYAKSTITPTDLADMNDACNYVFQGDIDKGKACGVKYDCKGTAICDKGFCADKVQKGTGALCGNPGEVCGTGQYCTTGTGTVYMCVARRAQDATCDAANPCIESLRCDVTCKARVAAAGTCTVDDDCVSTAPYCDPYSGNKCEVGLVFAPTATAACASYGGATSPGTGGAAGSGTGGTSGSDAGGTDALGDAITTD